MIRKRLTMLVMIASVRLSVGQDEKVRIYVTDSHSWSVSGGFAGNETTTTGAVQGGSRPQTAEIIKTLNEKCPQFTVTANREKAKYVILLDHEGGKGVVRKDNKVAVFNRDGDVIFSKSTRTLGNAVKEACLAIEKAENSQKGLPTQ